MTPGPWISIKDEDGWHVLHEGKMVTNCEANAHAMAAVPELIAAIKALLDHEYGCVAQARIALRLAETGRGAFWK